MSICEMYDFTDSETTCSICYAEFLYPEDLTDHMNQMHTEDYILNGFKMCDFCHQHFRDMESYVLHIRNEHLSTLKCCRYCNRVFADFDAFRKHQSKHSSPLKPSKYSCSNCTMMFTNVSELEAHEFHEHSTSTDGVFLNECYSLLSSLINIKAIRFLQYLGDDVTYVCVKCEHSSSDLVDYIEHLKLKNCRSLVCDSCSCVFKFKKGLIRHLFIHKECHHGFQESLEQCPECHKMLTAQALREHSKKCKAIKCRVCQIIFDTLDELSAHLEAVHPATMMLKTCKYCKKSFAGESSLKKHIDRSHKSQMHLYKYRCIYCDTIFKHPKNLFGHFFSTHKDLQPYTCKICNTKFRIRKKFTLHIKLDHKSIGFTEFDENYNVYFSDKKSEKPFIPSSLEPLNDGSSDDNEESLSAKIKPEDQGNITNTDISKEELKKELITATETEGYITEGILKNKSSRKRKLKTKVERNSKKLISKNNEEHIILSDTSDDEPLLEVKKKQKTLHRIRLSNATWNRKKRHNIKNNKTRFVCKVCNKMCYTYQNYNNHMGSHYKNVVRTCVKCSEQFKTNEALNKHYETAHSSTRLTEILKNIAEKRKKSSGNLPNITNAVKFQRTIKKVDLSSAELSATITPVTSGQSVKNFIESFTPETETFKNKDIIIESNLTIKPVKAAIKEPLIKMTKCNLEDINFESSRLSMPIPFKRSDFNSEEIKVTVKLVDIPIEEDLDTYQENNHYIDNNEDDLNESVPEMAQEVMLGGSEDSVQKSLGIPQTMNIEHLNLPYKGYQDVFLAHLQPEAPYFKIVKVNSNTEVKETIAKEEPKEPVQLPDGTKLVSVNPLAHLLGGVPLEKVVNKNKYYESKPKDFETAIAKALLKLDNASDHSNKRKKKGVK